MKYKIVILTALVFSFGVSVAQTNDYRIRNHKLNKHYLKDLQDEKHDFKLVRRDIDRKVKEYLARNAKFHKSSTDFRLMTIKEPITGSYRDLNYKLNRKNKMYSKSADNSLFTKN